MLEDIYIVAWVICIAPPGPVLFVLVQGERRVCVLCKVQIPLLYPLMGRILHWVLSPFLHFFTYEHALIPPDYRFGPN